MILPHNGESNGQEPEHGNWSEGPGPSEGVYRVIVGVIPQYWRRK